jgi:hypothetical protein
MTSRRNRRGPSEASIQGACDDLLVLDGWRILKTDLAHLRGLGVQEPGMPDRCYIRYEHEGDPHPEPMPYDNAWSQVMWIEWKCKRPGSKAAEHQNKWHRAERARCALVLVAGEDFGASPEEFLAWYNQSGLARRKLSLSRKRGVSVAEALAVVGVKTSV